MFHSSEFRPATTVPSSRRRAFNRASDASWAAMGLLIALAGVFPLAVGLLVVATPLLAAQGIHVGDMEVNGEPVNRLTALVLTFGFGIGLIVLGSSLAAWGIARCRRAGSDR